jgi:hypothetical protein
MSGPINCNYGPPAQPQQFVNMNGPPAGMGGTPRMTGPPPAPAGMGPSRMLQPGANMQVFPHISVFRF